MQNVPTRKQHALPKPTARLMPASTASAPKIATCESPSFLGAHSCEKGTARHTKKKD